MQAAHPPVIVLMTDFGLSDTYVGQMKGVILSLAPSAQIIDLTHAITARNIAHGAFLLGKSAPFFPEKALFVAVVDPGVGTSRKAIAVECGTQIFLAPDNGLLTALFQAVEVTRCVTITNERYLLPARSSTFHGRDVFSPAAAHLASGVSLLELGSAIDPSTCTRIPLPGCHTSDNGASWEGTIICTDHFGNLITSLDSAIVDRSKQWMVSAGSCKKLPLSSTYSDTADQQPLAYKGSSGMIEIAIRNGNAAQMLGLKDGDPVRAFLHQKNLPHALLL
jgi:S-adenosyl-L-methionine hydrolase (adenosine-forming)